MIEKFDQNKFYDDMLKEYIDKFGHEPIINRTRGVVIDKAYKLREAIKNNEALRKAPINDDDRKY